MNIHLLLSIPMSSFLFRELSMHWSDSFIDTSWIILAWVRNPTLDVQYKGKKLKRWLWISSVILRIASLPSSDPWKAPEVPLTGPGFTFHCHPLEPQSHHLYGPWSPVPHLSCQRTAVHLQVTELQALFTVPSHTQKPGGETWEHGQTQQWRNPTTSEA